MAPMAICLDQNAPYGWKATSQGDHKSQETLVIDDLTTSEDMIIETTAETITTISEEVEEVKADNTTTDALIMGPP